MKNTARFAARRIIQGGATFAALGALTVATAVPAAADTSYGWGYATASGGAAEVMTDVTTSQSVSDSFSGQIEDCFTLDTETTATVGANGVTATTVINSARVQLTQECFDEIPEEEPPTEKPSEEPSDADEQPTEEPSDTDEEPSEEPSDADEQPTEEPTTEPEVEEPAAEEPATEAEVEEPAAEEPAAEQAPASEPATSEEPANEVIELDESNSTLTSAGDGIIADVSVTGASVTTTQNWNGDISYSLNQGSSTGNAWVSADHYTDSFMSDGVTWNDGVTDLYVSFDVEEFQVTYFLGSTTAAVATVEDGGDDGNDGGDDGQDDSGDKGDDKNPPAREDEAPESAPEPKTAAPLAQTGSPVAGLIAAGAAIAAGGGLAAFFARRRKTATAADESSEG